jgi:hypothetical protein
MSPVDILAFTGINAGASYMAASHPSYRVSFTGKDNVEFGEDVRFVLGTTALLYSQLFAPERMRRPLNDISIGLLSSFFTTEIVRHRSMLREIEESGDVISEGNVIVDEEDLGSPSFNVWTPDETPIDETLSYSFGF